MDTNTIVLLAVVAMAAAVLGCALAAVTYKTRALGRAVQDRSARSQAEERTLSVLHQEAVANHDAATAYATQVEIDLRHAS